MKALKKNILLAALFYFFQLTPGNSQAILPNFPRPCGLYSLGTLTGGANDILNYPFVDGFVMRYDWTSIETANGIYNFETLDKVVKKLDSLRQGLTLDIFRMKVPSYILNTAGVETYSLRVGPQTFITAVPWDPYANIRFRKLMDTISNHEVFSITHNSLRKLKTHPVLKQIDGSPIGMNGIRDLYNQLIPLASYTRSKFVQAIVNTANDVITRFPDQFVFLAIFGINDNTTSPPLTTFLRDTLMKAFNRGAIPKLGFFQENLACSTPAATTTNTLFLKRDSTFTLHQMLQAWQDPLLNPALTNACIRPDGGPDVAILYGLNNFKSTYVEVYKADLQYVPYHTMFQNIHDTLKYYCGSNSPGSNAESSLNFKIYPNPAMQNVTIEFNQTVEDEFSLSIFNSLGQSVYHCLLNERLKTIDVSKLSTGYYLLKVQNQYKELTRKFVIQ